MEYRVILNSDCYTYDELNETYTDLRDTETGLKYLYDNAVPLKISGIIRPNEETQSAMLSGSIGYTHKLTEYVVNEMKNCEALQAQLDDEDKDIFTGLPFKESSSDLTGEEKEEAFRNYLDELPDFMKAEMYKAMLSIPAEEDLNNMIADALNGQTRSDMEETMIMAFTEQMNMSESDLRGYIEKMSDEDIEEAFTLMAEQQIRMQYAMQIQQQMAEIPAEQLLVMLEEELKNTAVERFSVYYEELLEFSDSTYEDNLVKLGNVDLDDPFTINLYASSFENKDVIEDVIEEYNKTVDELQEIKYTDYIGLMMSSVTTIINAITYVLIAFVSISLIVSSIMIGVITLISVQERTKEIGILRAIGASKRDVSSMFNAETVIIGFTSGLLGVLVTYALLIPINIIIHNLTNIMALNAVLHISAAVILVAISVFLTLIAGIIPSRSAAKKDPVVALRTE